MDEKTFFIVLFLLISILGITIYGAILEHKLRDKACQELGYKEFVYSREGYHFCRDYEYNLHYVGWGYNSFPFDLWVKEISVGDVRVLRGT